MPLTIILAESALQLIPIPIQKHPQIKQYAERRGKAPNEVLLDRAFHNRAMMRLGTWPRSFSPEKMGRPDIVHTTLLQVLDTPLNWEGHLRVHVHTQDDYVISVNPKIRLPKNYVRFVGLIEQLFKEKQVPKNGEPLLTIEKSTLPALIVSLKPSSVIGLSTLGKPDNLRSISDRLAKQESPVVVIGAFPRGHFTERTRRCLDEMLSVDPKSLDASIVAGRLVYEFEWSIGVAQNVRAQLKADDQD